MLMVGIRAAKYAVRHIALNTKDAKWVGRKCIGTPLYKASIPHEIVGGMEAHRGISSAAGTG
jgi:hypothetical protein